MPMKATDELLNTLQAIYPSIDFDVIHAIFETSGERNIIKTRQFLDELLPPEVE